LRSQYGEVYSDISPSHDKIVRKILNALYTLYYGMEDLDSKIRNHCNAPNVRKLGLYETGKQSRYSLREAFSALGKKHLSFDEKQIINEDLSYRKKRTLGFVEKVSSINPSHKLRGRKPEAKPQATPIKRPPRAPPVDYSLLTSSSSSSSTKRSNSTKRLGIIAKSSMSGSLKQSNEDRPSNQISHSPKANISKEIFGSDSEDADDANDADDADDEDDEDDDKSVLEIKCNQKGLSKLCKAIIQRKSAILDNVTQTESYFARKLEPVLCSIIELAGVQVNNLPYKRGTGACTFCKKTGSEMRPIYKCSYKECAKLNFCPKHMEHNFYFKHEILEGKTFDNK
jgi:hypothetical protein